MNTDAQMIQQILAASDLTRQGRLAEATALIQRALAEQGVARTAGTAHETARGAADDVIDVDSVEIADPDRPLLSGLGAPASQPATGAEAPVSFDTRGLFERLRSWMPGNKPTQPVAEPPVTPASPATPTTGDERPDGEFIAGSFSHRTGARPYKLFVPATPASGPRALVVMLHGCTQSADDFAAGTRMNDLARKHDVLVLYPAQTRKANSTGCWNWYKEENQGREQGEAALLAAMTRDVMARYEVDPRRVYVAGLSAGGAMAAVLAATHPDLYAAVGIHSGLPVGAAHDLPSALAAMKGHPLARTSNTPAGGAVVPAIVFHGDNDNVVHPRNGERVVRDALARGALSDAAPVESGQAPGGHAYSRRVHRDANGKPVLESWIVHGAGHAWSGGSHAGTYTDPRGPDASEAMLEFFLQTR